MASESPHETLIHLSIGAMVDMRIKTPLVTRLSKTFRANLPSFPQSIETKFAAEGRLLRPFHAQSDTTDYG